jgi:hypothetical protein
VRVVLEERCAKLPAGPESKEEPMSDPTGGRPAGRPGSAKLDPKGRSDIESALATAEALSRDPELTPQPLPREKKSEPAGAELVSRLARGADERPDTDESPVPGESRD